MRRPGFDLGIVSVWQDDLTAARANMVAGQELAVAEGDESSQPWLLAYLACAEYLSGRWQDALGHAAEAVEIATQIGQRITRAVALSTHALVRASRGEQAGAHDAHAALDLLGDEPAMLARMNAAWALGLLALSRGQAEQAHAALGPIVTRLRDAGVSEPGSMRFVTDDVEALLALDRTREAAALLDWFEGLAQHLDRASVIAVCDRCRGQLLAANGDLAGARARLETALQWHARVPMPFDEARTRLIHGRVLRRTGEKRAARSALDAALEDFATLGAAPWAALPRDELRRIGGRRPAGEDLSQAEQRVAGLAAQGLSNREIAATLFITPRTVEYHLSNVYRKLGLRSRTELATRLAGGETLVNS
jgi:DNA-binding CsgD family transcriptional regulator